MQPERPSPPLSERTSHVKAATHTDLAGQDYYWQHADFTAMRETIPQLETLHDDFLAKSRATHSL